MLSHSTPGSRTKKSLPAEVQSAALMLLLIRTGWVRIGKCRPPASATYQGQSYDVVQHAIDSGGDGQNSGMFDTEYYPFIKGVEQKVEAVEKDIQPDHAHNEAEPLLWYHHRFSV